MSKRWRKFGAMRHSAPRQEAFPARLQSLVDQHGSINDLFKISGVPVKTLSDWLRGVRKPHAVSLTKFAKTVGVSVKWLRDGIGPETEIPEHIDLKILDERRSLLRISSAWAQAWLGVPPSEKLVLVHALPDDAIPGQVEADEPVIFMEVDRDFRPAPGAVILIQDHIMRERILLADKDGSFPGWICGVGLWTGRRLNLHGKGSYK